MFFRVQTVNMGVPGEENWIFDTYLELRSYQCQDFAKANWYIFSVCSESSVTKRTAWRRSTNSRKVILDLEDEPFFGHLSAVDEDSLQALGKKDGQQGTTHSFNDRCLRKIVTSNVKQGFYVNIKQISKWVSLGNTPEQGMELSENDHSLRLARFGLLHIPVKTWDGKDFYRARLHQVNEASQRKGPVHKTTSSFTTIAPDHTWDRSLVSPCRSLSRGLSCTFHILQTTCRRAIVFPQ